MSQIIIVGFSDTDKVPQFGGETLFGQGEISLSSQPMYLTLCGLKASSGGTATADVDIKDILSEDDGHTFFGNGGELALMCQHAVKAAKGIRIRAIAAAAAGGAAAAAATITIAGSWTAAARTLKYRVGGYLVTVNLTTAMTTVTLVADAISAAFQANVKLPCSAANVAGVVTLTWKTLTVRGNDAILYQDVSDAPSGMTSTLGGGGAAVNGAANGIKFSGGSGVETLTNVQAILFPGRHHRMAVAQNDATSLASWETHCDSKAGVLEGRMEHFRVASNGTLSAATALGQTTLNNVRFSLGALENAETIPSCIAAAYGAAELAQVQAHPNPNMDGMVLRGVVGSVYAADKWTRTEQQSLLDNSVTPLLTNDDGEVVVVRPITTKSKTGSDYDYRTIDVQQAWVPDYVRDDLRLFWTTSYVVQNPHVAPDPADGEQDRPEGVATPTGWAAEVNGRLRKLERGGSPQKVLTQTALNPAYADYNATANRIMAVVPTIPLPVQHAIGVSVRQQNVAA